MMQAVDSVAPSAVRALHESKQKRGRGARKLVALGFASLALAAVMFRWVVDRPIQVRYSTSLVTQGPVVRTVTATGTVNPVLTIIIGSYVSGVISEMYCDYNTRVRKGQICARVDARPYRAALDQARGQLARDLAQLDGAKINLRRYAELDREDSIARQTYEDQAALVRQLTGTVQLDRAAVETAEVNLGYTNIVSPVDGTVVARNITIGQTVAASFQTPTLFLIATDLTRMQVDTNVSENDIGRLAVGQAAKFTVEAFGERSFPGIVAQVRQAPQTLQNVVTYDVVVNVDNPDFLLKPGMTATVGIVTDQRLKAVRVPDQALRYMPGGLHGTQAGDTRPAARVAATSQSSRVWVLRAGKPVAVQITTGLDDDTCTEVVAGDLRPGDEVIIGEQAAESGPRRGTLRLGG